MDEAGEHTLEVMSNAGWYNNWLIGLSEKFLGKDVLEIGAGRGNFSRKLSENHSVYAIDINPNHLKSLKKIKSITSGFGDIEKNKLFFKNKKFDSVLCFNVLEHIKDDSRALKNIRGLLKDGGYLIVIVPAYQLLFSEFDRRIGHYRRYTTDGFKVKAVLSGFKVKSIRYLNWVSAIGWFVFIKLLKRHSMPSNEVNIFEKIGPFLIGIEKFIKMPFGLSVYCILEK